MTRDANPDAPTKTLIFKANTKEEENLVTDVKTLSRLDKIDYRLLVKEGLKMMLRKHHYPPGNPQLPLIPFIEPEIVEVLKAPLPKIKIPDYESMSDEKLLRTYINAHAHQDVVKSNMAAFYLKKRGLYEQAKRRVKLNGMS